MNAEVAGTHWETMLNIATYHQQHERFYAHQELRIAAELQGAANTLKMLADGLAASAHSVEVTGVVLEDAGLPDEVRRIQRTAARYAVRYARFGQWLREKMDAGWERERVLVTSGPPDSILPRYMALVGTTFSADQMTVAAKLLSVVAEGLESLDLGAPAVAAAPEERAGRLQAIGRLLDQAVQAIGAQALRYGNADPWWSEYRQVLDGIENGR
jgi:hypothetical protein